MSRVFISYVRADTEADVGRLHDSIVARLGTDAVFMDTTSVDFGTNWKRSVEKALADTAIVLAVMGPAWQLSKAIELEIATALEANVPVVPVLVRGAEIVPLTENLPASIQTFRDHNAVYLRHAEWAQTVASLLDLLMRVLADSTRARIIVNPPVPSLLLADPPDRDHKQRLLDRAEDLSECLDDPTVFKEAQQEAWSFQPFAADEVVGNGKTLPQPLVRVVLRAQARLHVEQYARDLVGGQTTNRSEDAVIEEIALCLDDPSVAANVKQLRTEFYEAVEEFKRGGMISTREIAEIRDEISKAVAAAKARLSRELPGITRRFPHRVWPRKALEGVVHEW